MFGLLMRKIDRVEESHPSPLGAYAHMRLERMDTMMSKKVYLSSYNLLVCAPPQHVPSSPTLPAPFIDRLARTHLLQAFNYTVGVDSHHNMTRRYEGDALIQHRQMALSHPSFSLLP